jgi:hypothetical protein
VPAKIPYLEANGSPCAKTKFNNVHVFPPTFFLGLRLDSGFKSYDSKKGLGAEGPTRDFDLP